MLFSFVSEDVKSLSLPGTYHQKIRYLGTSLQGFARLKSLDLSRNAITSLSGLSHLTTLEALNLYPFCSIQMVSEYSYLQLRTCTVQVISAVISEVISLAWVHLILLYQYDHRWTGICMQAILHYSFASNSFIMWSLFYDLKCRCLIKISSDSVFYCLHAVIVTMPFLVPRHFQNLWGLCTEWWT